MENKDELVRFDHGLVFDYPKDPEQHMIDPEQVLNTKFDGNFKFYNKNPFYVFLQNIVNLLIIIIAYPIIYLRFGLKISGRENIKGENKKYYKGPFISTCNHVFEWDYLCVRSALRFRRGHVIVWKNNYNRRLGKLIRSAGSIPVSDNLRGLYKFSKDIDQLLKEGRWLHVYPEGTMWYYYQDVRHYKKGTFTFAFKNNVPVIPLAISFRPPKGLFKLWKRHGYPCVNITIGKPILPDLSLSREEGVEKLRSEVEAITKKMLIENTPMVEKTFQEEFIKKSHI